MFNVSVNGAPVLTNFDIFVAAGAQYRAIVEEFGVAANASGQVVVSFTPANGTTAAVNGIEIY